MFACGFDRSNFSFAIASLLKLSGHTRMRVNFSSYGDQPLSKQVNP